MLSPLREEVPLAQLERIHAERRRERVHLALVGHAGLDGAEGAVGAGDGIVRVRGDGVDVHVGNAVRAGGGDEAVEEHPRGQRGVGPRVRDQLRLERDQLAVAPRARPVAQDVRVPLAVADERFFTGEDELHRPPRLPHEQAEQALDRHVLLAAEAAAEIRALEPHAAMRQPQHVGHVAEVLEHLRAHPEDQHALGVDPSDARLGLDVDVIHEGRPVRLLHHHVGLAEPEGDVALAHMPAPQDIAALVHVRRLGPQRRLGIPDAGQVLVVDHHQLGGLGGDLRRLGGDGHDGLPVKAHAIRGEHGLEREHRPRRRLRHAPRQLHPHLVPRHVLVREHRDDPGQRPRRLDIDPHDPRRRIRAPHDPPMQHPRQAEVRGIDGPPPHLLPRIRPRRALADDLIARAHHTSQPPSTKARPLITGSPGPPEGSTRGMS